MKASGQCLRELGWVFLKLGATSFGGPAAHIAMMEDEVVRRRKWISHDEFLDLLGATNLIPGPNSTELAIHIGHKRGGWPGLAIAGCAFILPAVLIVLICAHFYVEFGTLPQAQGLLYGVKPVVIAVVVQALWSLAKTAVKGWTLATVGLLAAAMNLAGINELVILFGTGAAVAAWRLLQLRNTSFELGSFALSGGALASKATEALTGSGVATTPVSSLAGIFLFFAKVGSVLFGSGYVLLAFLRADLVERYGWLTERQLLDAIAVGQFTPGPVFTTATFIGYLLAGTPGAVVATVGIFLPAFLFVALSGWLIPKLRKHAWSNAFLDGVNVASMALMAVVACQLARNAIVDPLSVVLCATSSVLLIRYKFNSAWLVLGGGIIGLHINFT